MATRCALTSPPIVGVVQDAKYVDVRGTPPNMIDPAAYGASAVLLALVASVAAYLAAHRASRIDPMVALRGD